MQWKGQSSSRLNLWNEFRRRMEHWLRRDYPRSPNRRLKPPEQTDHRWSTRFPAVAVDKWIASDCEITTEYRGPSRCRKHSNQSNRRSPFPDGHDESWRLPRKSPQSMNQLLRSLSPWCCREYSRYNQPRQSTKPEDRRDQRPKQKQIGDGSSRWLIACEVDTQIVDMTNVSM